MNSPRSLRVTVCTTAAFGPGKADLLEAVDRCGSITAAAKDLGMSYRRAWLLLDSMNKTFCAPVIDASFGGKSGGGSKLTSTGRTVLDIYRRLQGKAEAAVTAELAEIAELVADIP